MKKVNQSFILRALSACSKVIRGTWEREKVHTKLLDLNPDTPSTPGTVLSVLLSALPQISLFPFCSLSVPSLISSQSLLGFTTVSLR